MELRSLLYFIKIRLFFLLLLLFHYLICIGQQDSILSRSMNQNKTFSQQILRTDLIAPVTFLTFGVVSVKNPYIKNQNEIIKNNLQYNHPGKFPVDDYTQYLPTASFLALDFMGVEAKNDFKSRLIVGAVSHALMAGTVNLMKGSIPVMRPDFSASNSFPSGHTATAFVGAELIWQEYRHQSIWYGIGAYAIASGTGFFRMYNNRHWFSDVVMGAGIGILSTKTAYWLLPMIESGFKKKKHPYLLYPSYNGQQVMLSFNCVL